MGGLSIGRQRFFLFFNIVNIFIILLAFIADDDFDLMSYII